MSFDASIPKDVLLHPHADVLGVDVSAINMNRALDLAERWLSMRQSAYICMTGVHGVMEAQSDGEFRNILNNAFINAPDGMPMSWVGWLQGYKRMDRVYGPDFMSNLCQLSIKAGYRHYLYGGQPGVAPRLKELLERRFPGLQVVGTYTPPFRNLTRIEEEILVADVLSARPDIIWVGLSTPKQERFMAQYMGRLGVPLLIGVGAAFDFHTGRLHEAPAWIQRAGLQWLHRLLQDPKRLWKRYLLNNPIFLWRIMHQFLKYDDHKYRGEGAPETSIPQQTRDNS